MNDDNPNLKPVAMGKVILALITWTHEKTRNLDLAEETMRALPIESLQGLTANMESVVTLAKRIIEDRMRP